MRIGDHLDGVGLLSLPILLSSLLKEHVAVYQVAASVPHVFRERTLRVLLIVSHVRMLAIDQLPQLLALGVVA
jgi:hypothetical protein